MVRGSHCSVRRPSSATSCSREERKSSPGHFNSRSGGAASFGRCPSILERGLGDWADSCQSKALYTGIYIRHTYSVSSKSLIAREDVFFESPKKPRTHSARRCHTIARHQ